MANRRPYSNVSIDRHGQQDALNTFESRYRIPHFAEIIELLNIRTSRNFLGYPIDNITRTSDQYRDGDGS